MAKNKQFCLKCKMELMQFRMVLTMGPKGFRRYPHCMSCADKLGVAEPKRGGRQRAKELAVEGGV